MFTIITSGFDWHHEAAVQLVVAPLYRHDNNIPWHAMGTVRSHSRSAINATGHPHVQLSNQPSSTTPVQTTNHQPTAPHSHLEQVTLVNEGGGHLLGSHHTPLPVHLHHSRHLGG